MPSSSSSSSRFVSSFIIIILMMLSSLLFHTHAQQSSSSPTSTSTILTTGSPTKPSTSSSPQPVTTSPENVTRHLDLEAWQLLIRQFEFLVGIERVVFDLCFDDFFEGCLPAMQADSSRLSLEWNAEDYRCTPRWCACYNGVFRVFDNQTVCLVPPITNGMTQICHEVEICNPMRYRCADDFVYVQQRLPAQCGKFVNCSLNANVIAAATIQCNADLNQCDTDLACQVQKDPLNELPPPVTLAPGWQFGSDLPAALRDIWIVTAAVFGLVLVVAVFAVVLLRHRQRQWDRWYEEGNEMSLERADDVVWFEPEKESIPNNNANDTNLPPNDEDPAGTAPAACRPKDLSCIRCGNKNAPIQLLPCRCRWCGCAEPGTYAPPVVDVSSPRQINNIQEAAPTTTTSAETIAVQPHGTNARTTPDQNGHSGDAEDQPSVQVSSLSCRGVPTFMGKIKKSIMDSYEERERQRVAAISGENSSEVAGGAATATTTTENDDDALLTARRRRTAALSQKTKPPRPRCDRCQRPVNFCINFNSLYYPAASQDASEDGGDAAANTFSPRQSHDVDEDGNMGNTKNDDDEEQEKRSRHHHSVSVETDEAAPLKSNMVAESPSAPSQSGTKLTANALSTSTSSSSPLAKKKKKVPTCCICLSEPCSVAIIACGHVAQCVSCAKKLCVPVARQDNDRKAFVISAKCPLCRGEIVAMASLSKEQNQRSFEQSASAGE